MAELEKKPINYGNLTRFYLNLKEKGLTSIKDVDELPDAEENKDSIVRLSTDNKLYVVKVSEGPEYEWEELGSGSSIIDITYAELKDLRDNSQLVPGQSYRITDYITEVNNDYSQIINDYTTYIWSAEHQFDIIVTAETEDVLYEDAKAFWHPAELVEIKYLIGDWGDENIGIFRRLPEEDYSWESGGETQNFYAWVFIAEGTDISDVDWFDISSDPYMFYTNTENILVGDLVDDDYGTVIAVGTDEAEEPDYFQYSNLAAWELKYSLDPERFPWAKSEKTIVIPGDTTKAVIFNYYDYNLQFSTYTWHDIYAIKKNPDFELDGNRWLTLSLGTYNWKSADYIPSFDWDDENFAVNSTINNKINTYQLRVGQTFTDFLSGYYQVKRIDESEEGETIYEPGGPGVIYYMKDEFNNECVYDFKNLLFDYDGETLYTFDDSYYGERSKRGEISSEDSLDRGEIILDPGSGSDLPSLEPLTPADPIDPGDDPEYFYNSDSSITGESFDNSVILHSPVRELFVASGFGKLPSNIPMCISVGFKDFVPEVKEYYAGTNITIDEYNDINAIGYSADTDMHTFSAGEGTTTQNWAESSIGKYNKSHKYSNTWGMAGNTLRSIGKGDSVTRANALEIMQNGDAYLYGVGNYLGTNTHVQDVNVKTVLDVISGKADAVHTHSVSDITNLETQLSSKADKVAPEPLCFTAKQANSVVGINNDISSSTNNPNIEICINGGNWSTWDYADITLDTVGATVKMRGMNPTGFSKGNQNKISSFTMTGDIAVSGNVMSLIDYTQEIYTIPSTKCFSSLFNGCSALSSIVGLTLPATTLSETCYYEMFYNCTNLTEVPILPARDLAPGCYGSMFMGCTGLVSVPEDLLPAVHLKDNCYFQMFCNCSNLKQAPTLPASILERTCYNNMFYGCHNLTYLKCLATNISAENCTKNWFYLSGSVPAGIFVKDPNMISWTTGDDGIPTGWTVMDSLDNSALYATILDLETRVTALEAYHNT